MRRIAPLVLLPLMWCLFTGSPAEANSVFFFVTGDGAVSTNPGTISYAGGSAPLVGSNIAIYSIEQCIEGCGLSLPCLECTLSFSTGPLARISTDEELPFYSFSGGGSLQIIGGVHGIGSIDAPPFLPVGTVLFTGVPTGGSASVSGAGFTETGVNYRGALHPSLASLLGFPAGASYTGDAPIQMADELSTPPNAFVLSTFQGCFGNPCNLLIDATQAAPLPATLWPFAVGFVALAAWREWRKTFPVQG